MSAPDPLARPLVVVALGEEAPAAFGLAARGLTLGVLRRLPLARIEAVAGSGADPGAGGAVEASDADVVLLAPGVAPVGGAASVVRLPAEPSPITLCTAAIPPELRRRRLRLLRRLGWLPEGAFAVAASRPSPAAATAAGAGVTWVLLPALGGGPRRATPARGTAPAPGMPAAVSLPAEASVDDLAAVVAEAQVCAHDHPTLLALAAGVDGEPADLGAALDRAVEIASAGWDARGRPLDDCPRRAAARAGARHTLAAVEAAAARARLADAEDRLGAAEAALASIRHSRTWVWSRAARGALDAARRRPGGPRGPT